MTLTAYMSLAAELEGENGRREDEETLRFKGDEYYSSSRQGDNEIRSKEDKG